MTKKSAKQEQQQLKPQAVALKPSQDKLPAKAAAILSKKGKKSSSIDAIFASAQSGAAGRHSQLQSRAPGNRPAATKPAARSATGSAPSSCAAPIGSKDDLFGTSTAKKRRQDPEGLPIYTPEELNIGQGGDTADCPFNCKCCF